MRIVINPKKLSLLGAGFAAALMATAPQTLAEPAAPVPPPPPPAAPSSAPVLEAAAPAPAPQPAAAPDPLALMRPAPAAPPPAPEEAEAPATPPEPVPHLASPEALPPGTVLDPTGRGNESPNVSYLKDLWYAVQRHEISGKEALIMGLAQRGMNTPIPDQNPGPYVPVAPASPAPATAPAPPAPTPPAPAP
ncbi:hypothetical protein AU189_12170 [Mycolicibacterium acapulense]|nr:hypothetical protein AU189_12170 [Mycolicibacterium acapulense]KUI13693.1 hypothetical protein AU191_17330 [Mycolicibacterium acapulense]